MITQMLFDSNPTGNTQTQPDLTFQGRAVTTTSVLYLRYGPLGEVSSQSTATELICVVRVDQATPD